MNDCIFCKIVSGDIPSYKIYEDDNFLAILDISQFTEGHTILIPKKHYEFIWDIPNGKEYFEVSQKISKHFMDNLGYKYVDSASFGRMVPHAHFHLIPHNGEKNDWSKAISKVGDMQTDSTRRPTAQEGAKIVDKFKLN